MLGVGVGGRGASYSLSVDQRTIEDMSPCPGFVGVEGPEGSEPRYSELGQGCVARRPSALLISHDT